MKKNILIVILIVCNSYLSYSQWTQIGADINGETAGYYAGWSVSLSANGNIIAFSGHHDGSADESLNTGRVRILENVDGTWTQIGEDITDEIGFWSNQAPGSINLSADGSIVAIGVPFASNGSGRTRVYKNIAGTWTQIGQDINGDTEVSSTYSGHSVSLNDDGNILAIGAPIYTSSGLNRYGHVRIYRNVSDTWVQIGQDIVGEANGDRCGESVSLSSDGSIVAISSNKNDGIEFKSGHVRVFQNVEDTWMQIGEAIEGEAAFDESGNAVSLSSDGSIVAIGATDNSSGGYQSGHVRVYLNVGGSWTQLGEDIDGESADDLSGQSVSLNGNGNIIAIGAAFNDGVGTNSGHVRVFQYIDGGWTQLGEDINGDVSWDQVGISVSLSEDGSKIGLGIPYFDGNGDQSGGVRIFENTSVLSTDTFGLQDFTISPNPVTTRLLINSKSDYESVVIYDINGRQLISITPEISNFEFILNVKDLSSGMYFLKLQSGKSKKVKKFIKK